MCRVNTSEDTINDTKVGLSLAEEQQSGSHSFTAHLANRSQSSLTLLPLATVMYTPQSQKAFLLQLASPDEQLEHLYCTRCKPETWTSISGGPTSCAKWGPIHERHISLCLSSHHERLVTTLLHTSQMGPGQSLMHLASDAVRAAAESPFLEEAVKRASAILCCISMPSPKQRFAGLLSPALELDAMLMRVILTAVFVSAVCFRNASRLELSSLVSVCCCTSCQD